MSDPSLLNIPYRFKPGTLYSQIPDSGLGDFVVSRSASNVATRVNAQGFIETVADNVPRLDYPIGGIAAGCPALLVEPSARNLLLQSEAFNTTWSALNGATVTPNTIASPDNNVTADTINLSTTADSNVRQVITSSNSTAYTISCFFKNIALVAGETFRFRVNNANASPNDFIAGAIVDLAAGTATYFQTGTAGTGISGTGSASIENYGNGWFRVRATFTTGTAGGSATTLVQIIQQSASAARSFYAWGAQLETGSVATSYIPTTTQAITRGADLINKANIASLIGQTEGTIYLDIANVDILDNPVFSVDDGTNNNRIVIFRTPSTGLWNIFSASSGVPTLGSGTVSANNGKLAIAYSSSGIVLYRNGVQVATNSGALPLSLSVIRLNGRATNDQFSIKRLSAVALYPTRLTNAQLQALTT